MLQNRFTFLTLVDWITKVMVISLSHAWTFPVLSSELPISWSNSNDAPLEQARTPECTSHSGPVVGLLLYTVGFGIVIYDFTGAGNRRKNAK